MPEKLIFSQTFEGLFRGVGSVTSEPAVKQGLLELGFDLNAPLQPAYPLLTFQGVMGLLGQQIAPHETHVEQTRRLAHLFIEGYGHTLVGRAMLGMMRVIGPHRTLARLARQFRTGNNFSETRLTTLGPAQYELWCNQVSLPGWYQGLLERGLERAGAFNVVVKLEKLDDTGGTFSVSWGNP